MTWTGSLVTVRWWFQELTVAECFEYLQLAVADGGSHTISPGGLIYVQAGVKTGHYTSGDDFWIGLA
ncbi:MAG: hypothetical protein IPK75_18875 [Acidobacteria bacterium]|nr:hypothetical protein [Acidobacteriota bacterium]